MNNNKENLVIKILDNIINNIEKLVIKNVLDNIINNIENNKIIKNNIIYDNIISLGYNCIVCNSMISNKTRQFSLPFDWNYTSDFALIEYFENDFNNFFKLENLSKARYSGNPSCEYIKNENNKKIYKIIYVHDGKYDNLIKSDSYYKMQYEKYKRRINRLLKLLNSKKNLLFIRLINKDDKIENLIKLENIIKKKYTNLNFKILLLSQNKNFKVQNKNIIIKYFNCRGKLKKQYYISKVISEFETLKYTPIKKKYYD